MFPVSIKGVLFTPEGECALAMNHRNEWELPGGRIDIGESPELCLQREFQEELGVQVQAQTLLDSYLFEVIPGRHVFIVTYGCSLLGAFAPQVSKEHQHIRSFPLHALPANLPPGYRQSIKTWSAIRN